MRAHPDGGLFELDRHRTACPDLPLATGRICDCAHYLDAREVTHVLAIEQTTTLSPARLESKREQLEQGMEKAIAVAGSGRSIRVAAILQSSGPRYPRPKPLKIKANGKTVVVTIKQRSDLSIQSTERTLKYV